MTGPQPLDQIVPGRLAIHRGAERQEDLRHTTFGYPLDQPVDPQFDRPEAACGGERAAQNMLAAVEDGGALHRPEILDLLDDGDDPRIA